MKKRLIIIGAGGAGREIAQIAYDICSTNKTEWTLYGFLDDSDLLEGSNVLNLPILGKIRNWIPSDDELFVCGIANMKIRKNIVQLLIDKGATFISLIHPTALISGHAEYAEGVVIYPYTVVSTNAKIGKHVIINMHNAIGHDAKIGDFSVLSSFCDITGFVSVGESVFLGSHATIAPNLKIGDHASIGIGSVVVSSVKDGKSVFGNPAKSMVI